MLLGSASCIDCKKSKIDCKKSKVLVQPRVPVQLFFLEQLHAFLYFLGAKFLIGAMLGRKRRDGFLACRLMRGLHEEVILILFFSQ
jgi:hypothetical protein